MCILSDTHPFLHTLTRPKVCLSTWDYGINYLKLPGRCTKALCSLLSRGHSDRTVTQTGSQWCCQNSFCQVANVAVPTATNTLPPHTSHVSRPLPPYPVPVPGWFIEHFLYSIVLFTQDPHRPRSSVCSFSLLSIYVYYSIQHWASAQSLGQLLLVPK